MSEAMNLQAQNLQTLNNLYLMQSLLTNMQTNVYLIAQGATGQTITVNYANLFQLAAQYYGDATLWTAIAEANGLSDPVVQATVTLTLNPMNQNQVIVGGFVEEGQIAEIAITQLGGTANYSYSVQATDTLNTIAQNLAKIIPGATYSGNIITLVGYRSISLNVYRFLTLTIPQNAPAQGGILNV
ncbi:MAG TPA: hypothetical protein VGW78_07500 [Candidatus Babeliales bacterium]|jgi:hypothetical protein|nr:hypothetical protein [Candidatus Babeliales bacterium]